MFNKILKYTGYFLAFLIVLIVVVILSLRIPAVQNFAKGKLVTYLEDKIHTKVSLESVYIGFPNSIVMKNLYLEGQKKDTLLYAKSADVGINLPKLLKSTADITSVDLQTVRANVVRNKNGSFNFDYILNAFATKDEEKTPSKPFIISLDKIKLTDIGVNFKDNQANNDINFYVKSFDTRVKTFDLQKNNYAVNNINVDGLKLKLKQGLIEEVGKKVVEKVDSLNEKAPMKLALNELNLTNFDIDYGDENSKTFAKIKFKELSSKIKNIDLQNNSYNVGNLNLKGANIDAKLFSAAVKAASKGKGVPEPEVTKGKSLGLLLNKLVLDDVKVVYDNTATKRMSRGIDFNHLNFSKMNLEVRNFKMKNSTFAGTVNSAEIQEKSGLNIQEFRTDFVYNEKQAFLKDLYLQTPKTVLRDELVLNYNSLEQLTANPGAIKISANIKNSKVGFSDILILAQALRNTAPFNKYPNAVLNLDTRLNGTVNNLNIQSLRVSGLDQMKVIASGNIRNAMQPDKLFYDLKIGELSSSAKTIFNLIPKGTIPSNIALPSFFKISGLAKGTTKNVNTNLKITTTLGNAAVKALVDMRLKNREKYDVVANLQNLKIGQIIKNKDVGPFTGNINVKGQSFDPNSANAVFSGNVNSAVYKNYNYRNMALNGKINRGAYQINLDSKDPNANLKLYAAGNLNNTKAIKVNGSIIKVDLNKLGFYKDPLILAGKIDGDFTNLDPNALNGYLHLDDFAVSDTKDVYPLQQINLTAVSNETGNQLLLKSQIADLELNGKYKLTEILASLQQTLNQYYEFQKPSAQKLKITPNQYFDFTGKIKDDKIIRKFVPELTSFEPITISGNYAADTQKLNVKGEIPTVIYGKNSVKNATLNINNQGNALVYDVNLAEFKNDNLALQKVQLQGDVQNNIITYNATTKDEKDVTKFLIAGKLQNEGDVSRLSLNPDGLKLNYDNWQVAPDNVVEFGKNGINAQNFILSNNGSSIKLQSENTSPNSPLNVTLTNFKIETITELIKKDSLLAKGNINGTAQVRDFSKNMTFTSDINISDLVVYGSPIGNMAVKVKNISPKVLQADINLSGNDNDLKLFGTYNTEASSLDMNLDMNRLQMKSVQGFSLNAIENAEGFLSGNLKISGTTKTPQVLGAVKFNDVGLGITKLGSKFKNINDEIRFTNQGINFDKFKIKDDSGNPFVIDGDILTQTYTDFKFNLDLNANDFKVVDSEKKEDKLLYGILAVDADLQVRGNLDLPKVSGKLAVTDKTDFTFVLPQSSPQLQAREGIVEFIDQDQIALQNTLKADSLTSQTAIKGLDVNINIEVNKEAKTSIVIDKANGDFIALQGEAQLTAGVDPSGKTTLVGVYTVEKGAYELSVSVLKRKFEIQKGSTITWTGEPTAARLDITANYKTKAAPYDLVAQQLGAAVPASTMNQFKQQIPFNTLLILKGELLKPQITFDITTDENNTSVSSEVTDAVTQKLTELKRDEGELNKQVFALLLLNRFVGENPFESTGGLSTATIAKQSVSKILSQQLNNLAGDLIGGVQLNFDLQSTEDYSTGTQNDRTDLNIGLSKSFLDDRLKVTVGNSFGVEGDARANEKTSNIAGDLTVDYALSKDGRYALRAYRKNEYQVALQGQIIETGVGFIITLDYNKFREIFEKQKKNRDQKNKVKKSSK
ncbi:translocation/assembly module TamB domain-containing protein [Halpernia frigidisoli]|uniref:translocation/assembly module TamB domain-containing protein n=1 Tax=Halpernia frigidisoli TaxID=1125876 RepID=UPI001F2DF817|nr:translocation/assembly module TamB [Halpernia frigidisoli]